MTFNSSALERLRALQGTSPHTPAPPLSAAQEVNARQAAPLPAPSTPPAPPRPTPRPPAQDKPQAPRPPVQVPPRPQAQPVTPARPVRPSIEARALMAGHCGTCRAFTLAPDEGRYMGICSHGRGAFEPWARHSGLPAVVHEAARCMTEPFPRWVLRAGVTARPDTDFPRGGTA